MSQTPTKQNGGTQKKRPHSEVEEETPTDESPESKKLRFSQLARFLGTNQEVEGNLLGMSLGTDELGPSNFWEGG